MTDEPDHADGQIELEPGQVDDPVAIHAALGIAAAERLLKGETIYWCVICGFPIFNETPHTAPFSLDDCHSACCPICNPATP